MLRRPIQQIPRFVYPVDEWRLVEKSYYPRRLAQMETLFSTANGWMGIRGSHEEGSPVYQPATLLNGFHETWPIVHAEEAFGFAKTGQTILNVPDGTLIRLYVDDGPFDLATAELLQYERVLDMRRGTLDREVVWEKHSGKQIRIRSRRLTSFIHRHIAAISYEVTLLNADAPIILSSELVYQPLKHAMAGDPRGSRGFKDRVLLAQGHEANEGRALLRYLTRSSQLALACGMDHVLDTDCPYTLEAQCSADRGRIVFSVDAKAGHTIHLTKYLTYHYAGDTPSEELAERSHRALNRAVQGGFESLLQDQRVYLEDFWDRSDVQVRGDAEVQQVMRFNLFHIAQASARGGGAGIPTKGLTGVGYEGQYFWDTEIYVMPFLIYTAPRIARNLLLFRYGMLKQARQRARELNQRGALFPWRTINGEEASAYYAAGTAQYHINADIIYALRNYVEVTGDKEFLYHRGAEMLVETARMWVSLGFYSDRKGGKFCINGVTGPDEYNTVVNNNAYTNLMARENLWYAASTMEWMREHKPDRFDAVTHETRLEPAELDEWRSAADNMHIPFDESAKIHLQDDDFLEKEPWDFAGTPPENYPLLLHYHPLVIYRRQVIKQADIVLAMFLLGHEFSKGQKRRNFDYYDPLTTGDSSLSVSIQGILAMELGYQDKAWEYGRYALLMDLADVGANVAEGCHIASMGGTWMGMVYGIAGLRDYKGRISFDPQPDKELTGLRFNLLIRGQRLVVDVDRLQSTATYLLKEGTELNFVHQGEEVRLTEGTPVVMPIKAT